MADTAPTNILTAERRVRALKEYISGLEDHILNAEAKEYLSSWLDFICWGYDSTVLMQWYPAMSSAFGFYLSAIQERIDGQKLICDKQAAIVRKNLESTRTKVTEGQAKGAALMDPTYVQHRELLSKLERLYNFLSYVKEGMDPNIIQAFGHNQRLERREDA